MWKELDVLCNQQFGLSQDPWQCGIALTEHKITLNKRESLQKT
jgi:hypothetical protein